MSTTQTTTPARRKMTVAIVGLNREVTVTAPTEKQALYDAWMALTDAEKNAVVEMEVVENEAA